MAEQATVTAVAASASSVALIAQTTREEVIVFNDSTATLYVRFGDEPATASDFTAKIGPGALMAEEVYRGAIQGVWSAANGHARVTEVS